jgi:hypothetical protein
MCKLENALKRKIDEEGEKQREEERDSKEGKIERAK